jgi:thiamine biosynthesis protein ThiS
MKPGRVAVELNRNLVPRSQWAETNLAEGDQLEIVHFVGGGILVAPASRRLS